MLANFFFFRACNVTLESSVSSQLKLPYQNLWQHILGFPKLFKDINLWICILQILKKKECKHFFVTMTQKSEKFSLIFRHTMK